MGSILFWACEDKSQVIFPCGFEKINERVAGRVSNFYKFCYNIY